MTADGPAVAPKAGAGTSRAETSRRRALWQLFSGSSVQAAAALLAGLVATRLMTPSDRGLMVVGTTIAAVTALVGAQSTGVGLRAILPGASGDERRALVRAYWWISGLGACLAAVIAAAAGYASAPLVDDRLGSWGMLAAISVSAFALTLTPQATDAFFAVGNFKAGATVAAASAIAGLAAVLIAVSVGRGPALILIAQASGTMLPLLVARRRLTGVAMFDLRRPGVAAVRRLLRVSTPALGFAVGVNVVFRSDRYMVGVFSETSDVAVYALAATLAEAFRTIPASIGQVLLRKVSLPGGAKVGRADFAAPVGLTIVGGGLTALGGWLLIPPIFGDEFRDARSLLLVLIVAEIALSPLIVAAGALFGSARTRQTGSLGLGCALLAIPSYALSVRHFGLWGAAWASVVLYAVMSSAAVLIMRHHLGEDQRRSRQ